MLNIAPPAYWQVLTGCWPDVTNHSLPQRCQGKITQVGIKAGTIFIYYDDNDNVRNIMYLPLTGPRVYSPIVTIEGYDDKPSPYAADPLIWRFTQQMMRWSYFGDFRMISTLCKNNPGKITVDYGSDYPASKTVDEISYQYNDQGMPTVATVQRTFRGTKSFYQSNN